MTSRNDGPDRRKVLGAAGSVLLSPAAALAQTPDGAVLKGDRAAIEAAWKDAQSGRIARLGRSDALVILQGGACVFEAYGRECGPTVRHVSWSMAKSFTHALVGVAVRQGRVDIDQPLSLMDRPHPGLTLRHLLNLTDGLDWREGAYSPVDSDASRMLFGPGRLNTAAYLAARRQKYPPGQVFNYSTGAFQMAAAELQARLFPDARSPEARRRAMATWMQEALFGPLGLRTALAEFDPHGVFYGGSLIYASPQDYLTFGEFYRQDGVWRGARILPIGWTEFARTPTASPVYGAGFWLESKITNRPTPALFAGRGPLDAYSAQGHNGQVVVILPAARAVIVRLGVMGDAPENWRALGDWLTPIANSLA